MDVSGYDPADLPWVREYQLCSKFGWSFEDAVACPPVVREVFLLYARTEAWARPRPADN